MIVSGQTKYTAELHWVDPEGIIRVERHAALEVQTATTAAWKRAKSMRQSGEAVAFTTRHFERNYA